MRPTRDSTTPRVAARSATSRPKAYEPHRACTPWNNRCSAMPPRISGRGARPCAARTESRSREPQDCRSIRPIGIAVCEPADSRYGKRNSIRLRTASPQYTALLLRRPTSAAMVIDTDRIDDYVLALLLLGRHNGQRVWKSFDWDAMDRLHKKG